MSTSNVGCSEWRARQSLSHKEGWHLGNKWKIEPVAVENKSELILWRHGTIVQV